LEVCLANVGREQGPNATENEITADDPLSDLVTSEEGRTMNFAFALSLILMGLSVVGVFIEIPFVSEYAFWFSVAAYIILAAIRD
jgi:hypothetical protein